MRILVATDSWFPDARGGSGRVAAETSRRLAARGHEVTVLAPVAHGAPAVELDGGLTVMRCLGRTPLPQTLTDTVSAGRWARKLDRPFDLVLAHQVTVAAGLAVADRRAPLVVVYHASTVREARLRSEAQPSRSARWSSRAGAAFVARIERSAFGRARRILVLSDYSRSLVIRDHPDLAERVWVTRGGVDTDRFSPGEGIAAARGELGIEAAETLLVAIRRLEPQLGVEALVHAFHRLRPSETTSLVLIGEGSLAGRLRELAGSLGVGDRVRLVHAPGEDDLRLWYRAADLFVLPPAPHEGFGMATLEALASGTPVVAAAVGANPELLEPLEPRLLARSADPDDLAAAVAEGLRIAGPLFRLRCREYACAGFDWDRVIPTWEESLANVVEAAD
jgi:glycosyltransferase involved in cell wall biosynthesis